MASGTPEADISKAGDTYFTNAYVDGVLPTYEGILEAAAKLYAGSHDLKDPHLCPVYGQFDRFPPTILISGTRDLFLSNTVRVHQKLLEAGVETQLIVFEGASHGDHLSDASSLRCS
jgi:acetyl esterase/lipase